MEYRPERDSHSTFWYIDSLARNASLLATLNEEVPMALSPLSSDLNMFSESSQLRVLFLAI